MQPFSRPVRSIVAPLALGVALALSFGSSTHAEPTSFSFKDPKGVNGVSFVLDSKLEPIVGFGGGIAGDVSYDPADPTSISGTITLSAKGLATSNARMTQVMQGADWLGISDHPIVSFAFKSAEVKETHDDGSVLLHVTGDLTLVGTTKEKVVPVTVTHLPDMAKARGGAESGDLLALRSTMEVMRSDFGIKPEMGGDVVAEKVVIDIPIVGYSQ